MVYLCSGLIDRHAEDVIIETAVCKLFCSEGGWQVIDDALQIWGGEGYMREHGLERMLRDARINRIVEGASEVMTAFVSLMGMKGVGESLESVLRQAKHPVGNFGRLAKFARAEFDDLVIGHALEGLHPDLADEGRELAKLTKLLARDVVRLLQRHREGILDMELIHQRVSLAVVDLYAMAAVISKLQWMLEQHGGNGNGKDRDFARDMTVGRSFCAHAAERVRTRLHSLLTSHEDDDRIIHTADAVLGWPVAGNGDAAR
jgi:hypothetical protein